MKLKYFLPLLLISVQLMYCQDMMIWKSKVSGLELSFTNPWKLIPEYVDTERKILVGVTDETDRSSITVKISNDVPKEQLSDEHYFQSLKDQMLGANSLNKFISEDDIKLNGNIFHRLIFSMNIKYGNFYHTIYINRNGTKMTGIQISYPKELVNDPVNEVPNKIQEVINDLKF